MHNQKYVHKQDYAYLSPCPENLKHKNIVEPQNGNSNNLTCILCIQKHKPNLEKHIKTYSNKQTKQTRRFKGRKQKKGKRKV